MPANQSASPKTLVRIYRGSENAAAAKFRNDAAALEKYGYYPVAQTWADGQWGCAAFLIAFLLCFVLVGFIVFVYLLIVKPDGTLTVSYELREQTEIADEKTCPRCAEKVKAAASACRFCGYEFSQAPASG